MSELDETFSAELVRSPGKGGWTYVVMPGSAEYFATRGLPVKSDLRSALAKGPVALGVAVGVVHRRPIGV